MQTSDGPSEMVYRLIANASGFRPRNDLAKRYTSQTPAVSSLEGFHRLMPQGGLEHLMRARKKDTCGTSEGLNKTIDSHPSVYKMGIIIGSRPSMVHRCSVIAFEDLGLR